MGSYGETVIEGNPLKNIFLQKALENSVMNFYFLPSDLEARQIVPQSVL